MSIYSEMLIEDPGFAFSGLSLLAQDRLVDAEDGCPACGERRMDELAWLWLNDVEDVECATCGNHYNPLAVGDA